MRAIDTSTIRCYNHTVITQVLGQGHTGYEAGWNSDLQLDATSGRLVKLTRQTYESREAADDVVREVRTYADQLKGQPLGVAELFDIAAIETPAGYRVRHEYEFVDGPSVRRAPLADRQIATAVVLSQMAAMDTFGPERLLRVPFDARAENFHIGNGGPLLVDTFPALSRRPDGSFPLDKIASPTKGRDRLLPWAMGTRPGVMTKFLSSAINRGDSKPAKVAHVAATTDEWCYDVLPAGLDGRTRDEVRLQIRLHFIPYLWRVAQDHAAARLQGGKA